MSLPHSAQKAAGQRVDIFVVRIYRRGKESDLPLAGVVETVGEGTSQAFHSLEELAELMGFHLRAIEEQRERGA